jgi:hypothetical protein
MTTLAKITVSRAAKGTTEVNKPWLTAQPKPRCASTTAPVTRQMRSDDMR